MPASGVPVDASYDFDAQWDAVADLSARFRACCEAARQPELMAGAAPSDADKLYLYALYKQVTEGDAPQRGFILSPVESRKHAEWANLRGTTAAAAMQGYVTYFTQLTNMALHRTPSGYALL